MLRDLQERKKDNNNNNKEERERERATGIGQWEHRQVSQPGPLLWHAGHQWSGACNTGEEIKKAGVCVWVCVEGGGGWREQTINCKINCLPQRNRDVWHVCIPHVKKSLLQSYFQRAPRSNTAASWFSDS